MEMRILINIEYEDVITAKDIKQVEDELEELLKDHDFTTKHNCVVGPFWLNAGSRGRWIYGGKT